MLQFQADRVMRGFVDVFRWKHASPQAMLFPRVSCPVQMAVKHMLTLRYTPRTGLRASKQAKCSVEIARMLGFREIEAVSRDGLENTRLFKKFSPFMMKDDIKGVRLER